MPTPVPPAPGNCPAFTTAAYAASVGLSPATAQAQLDDAWAIYSQIETQPWITRTELAQWATTSWHAGASGGVDRLNAALSMLKSMGCIFSLGA
jgi:hypothetical protein